MDKALFRAYVKELVKEQIDDTVEKTVRKLLPELLGEAVAQIKGVPSLTESAPTKKAPVNRQRMAELMGLERLGDTISANTNTMQTQLPPNINPEDPNVKPAIEAINRDYSSLMKKMGITK
jgi:hypothetical protein